ncbi:MAG: B12-binding domain-containing radical SAM protein [Desulfohalobiaceae bacterium]|nr:B12-binding domain-containing radical SAM protein [Desulfohalobiaceae bacterium]
MKIVFIYPNAGSQPGFNYGLAHMAGLLKQAGHAVTLWHLCEELAPLPDKASFMAGLQAEQPDVVGFSVVTNQWEYARTLAAWTRETGLGPIVLGGVHALADPEGVLQSGVIDYLFRGEAEEAFLEFVERLQNGQDLTGVRNLGYAANGSVQLNPIRPLPDLSSLPPKDYGISDFQRLIDVKNGWVGLMSSRGCPYACTYCFNHQMVASYRRDLQCSFRELNYIRHVSIHSLMQEIDFLLRRYDNITTFILDDDLFTYRKDFVLDFCAAYPRVSPLPFVINAHVNFFDAEQAKHLVNANCRIVKFGVESGSPRLRKEVLNRPMKNASIIEAIRTAEAQGLHSSVFLMLGLPGETREELLQTVDLMAEARPGRFRWSFFYPFPGTRACEIATESGSIDQARMAGLVNFTESSCLDFGPEQNLFLEKLGTVFPWFVNARSDSPAAGLYRERVEELLALDRTAWNSRRDGLLDQDRELSRHCLNRGWRHYAVKYNPFMGVVSDYFEKSGT